MQRLVGLSDGTWNTLDMKTPTNVGKLRCGLEHAEFDPEGRRQVPIYDEGVGTEGNGMTRAAGALFGLGLAKNVREMYGKLAKSYREGDEIFLFGFSRGAYTARRVASMIETCGLLKRDHLDLVGEAYDLFTTPGRPGAGAAEEFRDAHSRSVRIRFLGIWDTVGTHGVPGFLRGHVASRRERFHDARLSAIVDEACHAIALDEQRKAYVPTLWDADSTRGRAVEQRWFVGAHRNVGGGFRNTDLSDGAFAWMVERARAAGLAMDPDWVRANVRPRATGEIHQSHEGFWRLLGTARRSVGDPAFGSQAVDPQVWARWNTVPWYRPANLLAWRSGTPPPGDEPSFSAAP